MNTNYSRFRHLLIEDALPAPTATEIAEIERKLGTALPPSFLDFLRVANGGYLEYVVEVPIDENRSEDMSFCSVFSTREKPGVFNGTFLGEISGALQNKQIPPGVLPFARDGGGSTVYLDLTQEGQGRIVAFAMGLPAWAGLRTESAFLELADSFEKYVEKLRVDREMILDQLEHDTKELSHVDATEERLDIVLPKWREDNDLLQAVAAARKRLT